MSFRTTFYILIVFILLLFSYFWFIKGKEAPKETTQNISQAYEIKKEDVKKIRLSYKDASLQPLTIEKDAQNEWRLSNPVKAKADQEKVNQLISDLLEKNVKRTIEVGAQPAAPLQKYGLDAPSITFEVWISGSAPSKTFLIGNEGTEYSVYAKEKSEPKLITIESSALSDLTKTASDLRDRKIVLFDKSDISKLTLNRPGKPVLTIEKSSDDSWKIVNPIKAKADKNEVDKWLDDLQNLKADLFEYDDLGALLAAPLQKYGLDKPQLEIIISSSKNKSSQKIYLSRVGSQPAVPSENKVYAKSEAVNSIYSVDQEILSKLDKAADDIRDKTVLAFKPGGVTKIELKRDGKLISCEKAADGWKITKPAQYKADKAEIDSLLSELSLLKAEKFVSENATNLSQYGMDKSQLEVSLYEGANSKTFIVGKKSGESFYGILKGSDAIFLISADEFNRINKDLGDIRDKAVLKFERDNAIKLDLKYAATNISCSKAGTSWLLTSPIKENADNVKVNDIIDKLAELKTKKFVSDISDKSKSLSSYGLEPPELEVSVKLKDNAVYELLLGKKSVEDDRLIYAKLKSSNHVFLLESSILNDLKKGVDDLRQKKST